MSQAEERVYEGEVSFEDAVASVSKSISEGLDAAAATYRTEEPAPAAEKPPEPPSEEQILKEFQGISPDQETEPQQEAKPAEETSPEPEDKALVRLVQREAALDRKKAQLEERETALKALETSVKEYNHWKEDFQADPVGFIREHLPELDLASTAEQLWYGQDPSKAPVHHRALQEARAARREAMKARRGGVQAPQTPAGEEEAGVDDETVFNQYLGSMRSYVESIDDKAYPLVARFANKHGAERAYQAIFEQAQRVAQATNGERVLTPAEAAAEAEQVLKNLQLSDAPVEETPQAPVTKQAVQSPPTSIRNSHTQIQHDRQPPDTNSDEYLRYKAFRELGYDEASAKRMASG